MTLGVSGGLAFGGHARVQSIVWSWRFGAIEYGGFVGVHAYPVPGRHDEGYSVSGIDLSTRGGLVIGHAWRLAKRRFRIATSLYTAASWRHQQLRLSDPQHAILAESRVDRVGWEHGAALEVAAVIHGPWAITFDAVVPVFWSGATGIRRVWWWSSPFAGVGVSYQW